MSAAPSYLGERGGDVMNGRRTAPRRTAGGRRVLRGGRTERIRRAIRNRWTERSVRALACLLALPLLALLLVPRQETAGAAQTGAMSAGQDREKYIALTFDDGPWPVTTELLLDGLAERDAKATFFLIGEQIGAMEDTVRRMQAEGHQVGNHTYTHMDLSRGDSAERLREIEKTDETLRALLGEGSYWLRPPWGFLAADTAQEVRVPMVYWSLDTEDWRRLDTDAVAQHIINDVRSGDIVLLHDPYSTSVEAALRAIDALAAQGYRFITLEELFAMEGVTPRMGTLYVRPDEEKPLQ